jgi:hypothetical protein
MKKTMNYEAPVAEMIKMQTTMVLMSSNPDTSYEIDDESMS